MLRTRTWLAVLAALPVVIVAIRAISLDLMELSNPCVAWGVSAPGGLYRRSASDPCPQRTFRSDTRTRAAIIMLAIPGVIVLAAGVGIWAAARSRKRMMLLAACVMFCEALPLAVGFWGLPLALLAGGGFLYVACRISG
jgi:hypothetical protein